MTIFYLILFVIASLTGFTQDKKIIQEYPNGKPSLIIIMNSKNEKVKEISYFENGAIDYEGTFKNGVEHGIWTYYYENGNKKYIETYKNGVEEGKHYEYSTQGQLEKIETYSNGKLIDTNDNP